MGKLYLKLGDLPQMKRLTLMGLGALLLLTGAGSAFAQVKRVEMKIDGYLCGN
jgi:hypothetical protein